MNNPDREWQSFSQHLTHMDHINFSCADETEEIMTRLGVDQKIIQLSRGGFKGKVANKDLKNFTLLSDRFSNNLSCQLAIPERQICILMPTSISNPVTICGTSIGNDKIVILPSGASLDINSVGLSGTDAILIPEKIFDELIETLDLHWLEQNHVIYLTATKYQLADWIKQIHHLMLSPCNDVNVEEFLYSLFDSNAFNHLCYPKDFPKNRLKQNELAMHIRDYLHAHYHTEIRLSHMSKVFQVSTRTLQRCFQMYFNTTIISYLEAYRFNQVHQILLNQQHNQLSLQHISLENGFYHFGRFSSGFKRFFNYSASSLVRDNLAP